MQLPKRPIEAAIFTPGSAAGGASLQQCRQSGSFINPLLVVTSGRYKNLARQKVGFTAAFQSHRHPPEMVSPTHLETIYCLDFENWGGY